MNLAKRMFLVLAPFSFVLAQEGEPDVDVLFYPYRPEAGEFRHAVGVTLAKPPDEVVEEFAAVLTTPLLEYQAQYGISGNFLLEGRVTTLIASNHVAAGLKWIVGVNPFGFSLGSDLAYWFGSLNTDGFDNTVNGWTLYPNISAGYHFRRFAVTVKIEANLLLSQNKRTGGISVQRTSNTFNGGAITVYLEQPLWKDNYISLGIKSNFVKYYYVVWPGFPTFEHYSYIPEFTMELVL
ncbi:MAG TPA: hypothetical protein VGA55_06420 [Bacteroidota bacterium]